MKACGKYNTLRKALKIIHRLEASTSDNSSKIKVLKRGEKIFYINKENHLIGLLIFLMLMLPLCLFLYFNLDELDLFIIVLAIFVSMKFCLLYFSDLQTKNNIEIDLIKREIRIIRIGFLGKTLQKNKIVKTQKSNEIIKEDILFSDSNGLRITLKNKDFKIPLFDLDPCDSNFGSIFLSLKLLAKGE